MHDNFSIDECKASSWCRSEYTAASSATLNETQNTSQSTTQVSNTIHLRDAECQMEGDTELLGTQAAVVIVIGHREQRGQQIGIDVGLAQDFNRGGVVNEAVGSVE